MHYSLGERQHRTHLRWAVLAGLVVILGLLIAYVLWKPEPATAPAHAATSETKVKHGGGVMTRMMFVGDVMWGRTVQTRAAESPLKYRYITSGLTKEDREQYDAWIANFECPITQNNEPTSVQISALKFNCRPEFLPNLAKWFTAASLSNNHTMNQDGQTGLVESRTHLEQAGIQYFGNYDMTLLDDICEVITVPAKTTVTKKIVSMPLALCGYHQVVNVAPTDEQLAVMQKYARVMPVIAMPHMGVEYRSTAENEKVSAYHRMIDAGADAVIAAHPHVIQNSEVYQGKLIAYSLGNFLFDQQSLGQDTSIGLGVGITLRIENEHAAEVYQRIAPSCRSFRDTCVTQLASELTTRPVIQASYSFVCYDMSIESGRVPRLGSKSVCDKAKQTASVDDLVSLTSQW